MPTLVLIALLAGAFTLQYRLDVLNIGRAAGERRWNVLTVRWTPWSGFLSGRRLERAYAVGIRDENGQPARCRCRVTTFHDPIGVFFESVTIDARERGTPISGGRRLASIAVSGCVGGFLGLALGVGGSLLLFPTSNIAPAYGILLTGPLGLGIGALYGALRGR